MRSSRRFFSSRIRRLHSSGPPRRRSCSRTSTRTSSSSTFSPTARSSPTRRQRSPPSEILALYHAQKPNSLEGLKRFVVTHFELPADAATPDVASEQAPIRRHIDALWERLTRDKPTTAPYSSLLPLPRPYVVPGGRFRELYYWDSYFTMLGLAESGRTDLLEDMVQNFADLIDAYGHAPNGTRSYYLTRSQPPFFFAMVGLLSPADPAASFARYLPQLKTEYAFWMEGAKELTAGGAHRRVVALDDGSILNRYWDDSDAPRDESYREDVVLAAATPRRARRDLSRYSRRRRERLGFQLAMVRRFANACVDRHDRNHPRRPQRSHVRARECDPRRLRTGRRSRLRRGLRQTRRRAARCDRSLSLGSIARRLSRLSLDAQAAHRRRQRRDPLSAVYASRERGAGGFGRESRRGRTC